MRRGTCGRAYAVRRTAVACQSTPTLDGANGPCHPPVALIAIFSFILPNARGILDQRHFEQITSDCGWTVMQTEKDVDGVFVEEAHDHLRGGALPARAGRLQR